LTLEGFEDKIYSMLDYAICEILGKQYKLTPNQPMEVDYLGEGDKDIEAAILFLSENNAIKIGTPYLKDKLTLKCLDTKKGEKIRVAKFHAKANFRKVIGHRSKKTRIVWTVKKSS